MSEPLHFTAEFFALFSIGVFECNDQVRTQKRMSNPLAENNTSTCCRTLAPCRSSCAPLRRKEPFRLDRRRALSHAHIVGCAAFYVELMKQFGPWTLFFLGVLRTVLLQKSCQTDLRQHIWNLYIAAFVCLVYHRCACMFALAALVCMRYAHLQLPLRGSVIHLRLI